MRVLDSRLALAALLLAGKPALAEEATEVATTLSPVIVSGELVTREAEHTTSSVAVHAGAAAARSAEESSSSTLPTITVHGEKTERSLQDTASSVVVIDATDLERRAGLATVNEVLARIANVTLTEGSNFAPAIRAIDGTGPAQGADAALGGTRSRVALFIDGRPASYNEITFGDASVWDVEQIEVFRGPQSTLQGRNAIGGAIVVRTKDPSWDFESAGRLVAGNHELRQAAAMISGPIVDRRVAYRLAVERLTGSSDIDMLGYERVPDPAELEATTLRGKLLFESASVEGLSTLLTINHADHTAPQVEFARRPFADRESPYQDPDNFSTDPTFNPRSTGAIIDTRWNLSGGRHFENKLAYTDVRIERRAQPGNGNVITDIRELFLEPRLAFGALDGRLSGFGALYLFRADQDEIGDIIGGSDFEDLTTTAAVFGELTYALTPALDLIAGGRYEQEKRERSGSANVFVLDFDETYSEFLPKLGLSWQASGQWTLGATVARGYNGGGAGFTYDEPFTSYAYDAEYVWNYEVFARAALLDRRVTLQANAFVADYEDLQLPFDLNPDPQIWSVVIRNAERARVSGAEFGARWLALPGLELFGDVGVQRTEIRRYPNEQGQSLEGNELARAPDVTANAGFTWRHGSGFELGADVRYSSAYYSDVRNQAQDEVDAYWLVNAQAGYRIVPNVRVFAYATNLLDADEPVLIEPGDVSTPDDDVAALLRARRIGIGVDLSL
ncbi:TonB-dependent receptor [Sinimarinibacterium thermocellulolyticum]|uniref:TonB-dependent receptor n=1 Tax=Sinimarinibacterium thermocellulolyticum TaxID=3170016 RepID=A0ABV2A9G9_9GAMM